MAGDSYNVWYITVLVFHYIQSRDQPAHYRNFSFNFLPSCILLWLPIVRSMTVSPFTVSPTVSNTLPKWYTIRHTSHSKYWHLCITTTNTQWCNSNSKWCRYQTQNYSAHTVSPTVSNTLSNNVMYSSQQIRECISKKG